ncbi:uncharacterized protein A4U43_C05F8190 [Asparagus officinalis]|uniref:Uncharacterized protein n=1 Tax=Asparagus officinalis TaxID=4686 RepID=A0A5P1EQ64_ASPOF|nr:uncharacterized protein A4U43_C05F8190 [Asparagus officinalis]
MIDTLEQLTQELTQEQTEGENVDAWHLVNKKEHPGRVRLRGRAITQSMLQSNKEKAIDPCDQVPESIVQAITKKVVATQQEEMKRQQEAQATKRKKHMTKIPSLLKHKYLEYEMISRPFSSKTDQEANLLTDWKLCANMYK